MNAFVDSLKVALLGMAVTIAMLLLIIGFIRVFGPIRKLFQRIGSKRAKSGEAKDSAAKCEEKQPEAVSGSVNAALADEKEANQELAAVISAAIACFYGQGDSNERFIIKSIRRRDAR